MIDRCRNPNSPEYGLYGGRGISVCERWYSFEKFLEDMGERPTNTSIDRFPDKNGNYEKSNCRWATTKQQNRNKRNNHLISFNGETHCLTDWAKILGVSLTTLSGRLATGWSVEKALTTRVGRYVRHPRPIDND
jgi:hypothetical protein